MCAERSRNWTQRNDNFFEKNVDIANDKKYMKDHGLDDNLGV